MQEEEKLARDVYIKMYEIWGAAIFSNISVSEQRHMDAVLKSLVKYRIPDPVSGNPIGFFTNSDLQLAVDETSKTLLDKVYGNLLRGSFNHLRSFNSHIDGVAQWADCGFVFTDQVLFIANQDEVAISLLNAEELVDFGMHLEHLRRESFA